MKIKVRLHENNDNIDVVTYVYEAKSMIIYRQILHLEMDEEL